MNDKVALGLPIITREPTWGLFKSLIDMNWPGGRRGPSALTREWGLPVDEARNELCRWFLEETDCDWLLQVDHDAVLHRNTVLRLHSWNKPIVAALAFVRMRPVQPAVITMVNESGQYQWATERVRDWINEHRLWRAGHEPAIIEPPPEDALHSLNQPPGYSGMHCVLMRRDALEQIKRPWFQRLKTCVGEDRYFFTKAVTSGVEAYVDLSCIAGHQYGEQSLGVLDFMAFDALTEKLMASARRSIAAEREAGKAGPEGSE